MHSSKFVRSAQIACSLRTPTPEMSFQGSGLFDASAGGDFAGMAAFAGQEGQGCSGDFAAMAAFAGQEGQGCAGDFAGMAGFAGQEGQGCGGCGWDQMGAWPSQQLGSTDGDG